jgi:hypothetical protein
MTSASITIESNFLTMMLLPSSMTVNMYRQYRLIY